MNDRRYADPANFRSEVRTDDTDLDECNEPGGHRPGTCYHCDSLAAS